MAVCAEFICFLLNNKCLLRFIITGSFDELSPFNSYPFLHCYMLYIMEHIALYRLSLLNVNRTDYLKHYLHMYVYIYHRSQFLLNIFSYSDNTLYEVGSCG